MPRFRVVLVVVLVLGVALGTAVLWTPPTPGIEQQASAAIRLQTVLPVLDELGVSLWRDQSRCRYITTGSGRFQEPAGCGDASPFDAASRASWDKVAAAAGRLVDGARIESILVVDHTVVFITVPRTFLGQDALLMRWNWTWDETHSADPGLPDHWRFHAANQAVV